MKVTSNAVKVKPTFEAEERFGCNCDPMDNCSCLMSSTCSVNCTSCSKRVWFPGYVGNKGNPKKPTPVHIVELYSTTYTTSETNY